MIPILKRRLGRSGGSGNKGFIIAAFEHTKNGTFQIDFRGTNGAVLYCDPGNGAVTQTKTLLGTGTTVSFSYANDGTRRKVRIWGQLSEVTLFTMFDMDCDSDIRELGKFINLAELNIHGGNTMVGCLSSISKLSFTSKMVATDNTLTYVRRASFPTASVWGNVSLRNCLSTATEVDNVLIDLAAAGYSNATLFVDGTCPARTSASDAAVVTLLVNSVTLFVNE